jgi:putative transposase
MPWKKSEPMEQRIEFGLKSLRTENFRALCREYGISSKTGSKWRERFLGQGSEGMAEESGRPQSHPESLGEEELCKIIRLKQAHPVWGPRKIRELWTVDFKGWWWNGAQRCEPLTVRDEHSRYLLELRALTVQRALSDSLSATVCLKRCAVTMEVRPSH